MYFDLILIVFQSLPVLYIFKYVFIHCIPTFNSNMSSFPFFSYPISDWLMLEVKDQRGRSGFIVLRTSQQFSFLWHYQLMI